jgi:signal transduction histidine kinase/ligand-binding sensor domain-containing protein
MLPSSAVRLPKRITMLVLVFIGSFRNSLALNPSLDINQYAHNAWTIRGGFFRGIPDSFAQTPDGYLWIGTEFGLVRFDGVRPVEWTPPGGERLPSELIRTLAVGRDGTLWIGTDGGLASWNGGKLSHYPELDGHRVQSLLEDHEGTLWVGTFGVPACRLCSIRGSATRCYGQDGVLGRFVFSLSEDAAGNLWAGAQTGLWRWKPQPALVYRLPHSSPTLDITDLTPTDDGRLLIATNNGMMQLVDGRVEPSPIRGSGALFRPYRTLRDRDGSLWIGTTNHGILHTHQGRTDVFSRPDGLSADTVLAIFEDREGNIWSATYGGIDRFRDLPVVSVSVEQGLTNDAPWSVLAARDGSVWAAGRNGLDRWKYGQVTTFKRRDGLPGDSVTSLFEDGGGRIWAFTLNGPAYLDGGRFVAIGGLPGKQVYSIAEGEPSDLWLSADRGLLHFAGERLAEQFSWSALGHTENAHDLVVDRDRGGAWLGFGHGGVFYFRDGQVRASYTGTQGLGEGRVSSLKLDREGALWAATDGGLSMIKDERVATLTSKNGLPCDTVYWRMEANDHSNWLYTACGLVRIAPGELEAWVADPKRRLQTTLFDASDGVVTHATPGNYSPRVVKDTDGRIWFVSLEGVSVFDPAHFPSNRLPPPVHIESIKADGKPFPLARGMRLPAKVRDVWIDYTALSLVAPEKVRFKYMLEGQDRNWKEVVNDREAQYSNLPPRNYRFRVIASNNSGVWNETGDTLEFSIDPAYYQTAWFYASCVAAFLAMLWGLYWLRLYQVRREFNAQLDGRVEERMRVARELHDTLLQSFQASLIQMQAARNVLARRPEKAEQSLDKAITTAAGAVAEGRNAIQDLREHPAGGADLPQLLTAAGQELAHSGEAPGNPPAFAVTVEGERRDLEPLLQDELYRIARELLRNAVRHAQAGRIEVEIRYESRQLRVHVRDDGKGIDPEVLKAGGRAGHYGLPGMRERAGRFGGKLDFWSEAGAGTEAVLTVPATAAYGASNGGAFSFLRRKLWIHER